MRRSLPHGRPPAFHRRSAFCASGRSTFSAAASPAAPPRLMSASSQPAAFSPDDADVAWVKRVTLDGRAIPIRREQDRRAGVGSIGLRPHQPRSRRPKEAAAPADLPSARSGAASRSSRAAQSSPPSGSSASSGSSSSVASSRRFVRARRLPDHILFGAAHPQPAAAPAPPAGRQHAAPGEPAVLRLPEPPAQQRVDPDAPVDDSPLPETPAPQPQLLPPQQQQQQPTTRDQPSGPDSSGLSHAVVPYRHVPV